MARQILMGHGHCAKIWPQLRLTKAWSRRAEARGSCRALGGREGLDDVMREKGFEPGAVRYERDLSSNYPMARMVSAETADTWSSILRPFLTVCYRPTVLDLGCGTGRFSTLISDRFGAIVVGLDPSIAMLHTAVRNAEAGRVQYAAAQAEQLPLTESSCDVAWLSQVVHHIRDRRACAAELHRVLRSDGVVLIRGTFGDQLDGFPTLFKFFPVRVS